jgi:lipoprotein-releasing system permease protein
MFHLWLVYRFLVSGRRLLNLPALLSVLGMTLGVASLTVAMGVVSGFEQTLRTAIIDVFGDVMIVRRGERSQQYESIVAKVKKLAPEVQYLTPFVSLEGVIVGDGRLAGVLINGVEAQTVEKVLNLRPRVIGGEFSLAKASSRADLNGEKFPSALVGKILAKKFSLKVGDAFKVVLPTPSRSDSSRFSPKVMTFVVSGILDLGKADYDERTIITDLRSAQQFAGIGENFSGMRIRLVDSSQASNVSARLSRDLGTQYWTMDWSEVNRNLFEAVKVERVVIFFVILIMVIAASFNISSNLFVSVLRKYSDIAILRAMGFSAGDVRKVFLLQGLFFGVIGTAAGLALGFLLGEAFVIAQRYMILLPVETYQIDHVGVQMRGSDIMFVVVAALLVCVVSTYVPARRGAKLDPVEGLRYE